MIDNPGSMGNKMCVCVCVCNALEKYGRKVLLHLGSNWSLQSIFNPPLIKLPQSFRGSALPSWRTESRKYFTSFFLHSFPRSQTGSQFTESAHRHVLFGLCSAFKKFCANILVGRFHMLICISGLSWEIRR